MDGMEVKGLQWMIWLMDGKNLVEDVQNGMARFAEKFGAEANRARLPLAAGTAIEGALRERGVEVARARNVLGKDMWLAREDPLRDGERAWNTKETK
jgi:hypothetical protein